MPEAWITQQLAQHGYSLVLFPYDTVEADALPEGAAAAANSSRVWQEQTMTRPFLIPGNAKTGIHHRKGDEPDSLSFEYPAAGYLVRAFHQMDQWAITLRAPEKPGTIRLAGESVERAASRLARQVFQYNEDFHLLVEHAGAGGVAYGQEARPADRKLSELFPVELLEWWYDGESIGFGVPKVTPVIGNRYPSTLGFSRQQVVMWFDTFGIQRHL